MKVIVTGCAGFIASHLIPELLNQGAEVYGVDDLSNGNMLNMDHFYHHKNFDFFPVHIKDISEAMLKGVDTVYNFACAKNRLSDREPLACIETNVRQTFQLFMMAEKCGVRRVVHSSTGSVYGDWDLMTIDERTKCRPVSFYGINKLAGESYARMFNFQSTVLRYFHVYGERGNGVVNKFINLHRAGKQIEVWGDGNQIRCFTHVSDVVKANLTAQEGTWNVCSGIRVTVNEVIDAIEKASGRKVDVEYKEALKNDITDFRVRSSLPIDWKKDFVNEVKSLWDANDTINSL